MNLSGVIDDDSATFQQFDVNVTQQPLINIGLLSAIYVEQPQQDELDLVARIMMMRYVMAYLWFTLGVPGNVLSAIIWLRRYVTNKNSSALYLAVLAINDLLYLLIYIFNLHAIPSVVRWRSWLFECISIILNTTHLIEPLLVLGFSVERLIAISCPLQVRCLRLNV